MLQCMNHLLSLDILSAEELADVAYYTPLKLLGLEPTDLSTDQIIQEQSGGWISLAAPAASL